MSESRVLVIDVETTGKEFDVPIQIIQLAWGWWDGAKGVAEPKSFMCMPIISWESDWHKEHKLTMDDVHGSPPLEDMVQDFISDLEQAEYLMGYNVEFDIAVISRELHRLDLDVSVIEKPYIDPYRIWDNYEPNKKLETAFRRWVGEDLVGAHDASVDIVATAAILPDMLSEFDMDDASLDELVEYCKDPAAIGSERKMKWRDGVPILDFGKHVDKPVFAVTWSSIQSERWYARNYHTFQGKYAFYPEVQNAFAYALAFENDEEAFIEIMSERFGGPPIEEAAITFSTDERTEIMTEIDRYCSVMGKGNIRQYIAMCKEFNESEFSKEDPIEWIESISYFDTELGGNDWIDNYGNERLGLLRVLVRQISDSFGSYKEYDWCPSCGVLHFDENGNIDGIEGGKIVEEGGGGPDSYWYRVGCNNCDFEWNSESG